MLTSSKKPAHQYLRKLMVLPIVAVATLLFSFTYHKELNELKTVVEHKIATPLNQLMTPEKVAEVLPEKVKAPIKDTVPVKKKNTPGKAKYDTEKRTYYFLDEVTVVSWGSDDREIVAPPRDRVDIFASYPGGRDAWKNYLERNLRGDVPVSNGAKPGMYKVNIKFIIEPNGSLSNFEPLTDEGYGMEEEAIRVLSKSGKWNPSLNNKDGETKPVRAYRVQQFTFQVLDNGKPKSAEVEVKKADTEPEPEIFTKVQTQPSYPGGAVTWRNFLERNLKGETPVEHKAPVGDYTVNIQFLVDKNGNVSDIKPLTKLGYGMEEEAMRVIKSSGKWKPAAQSGRIVKAYHKVPVKFQIIEN